MRKLSEQEIERIVNLLKEGKPLPDHYKDDLFDTKKEYELIYADKEREEDILADTMAVPLPSCASGFAHIHHSSSEGSQDCRSQNVANLCERG